MFRRIPYLVAYLDKVDITIVFLGVTCVIKPDLQSISPCCISKSVRSMYPYCTHMAKNDAIRVGNTTTIKSL